MSDEEAIGLSEILALQRQRQPLIRLEEFRESVRFDVVYAMVEDHLLFVCRRAVAILRMLCPETWAKRRLAHRFDRLAFAHPKRCSLSVFGVDEST